MSMGTSCGDLSTVKWKRVAQRCSRSRSRSRSRRELKVLDKSPRADATQFTRTPGETSVALMLDMIVDFCTEDPVPRYSK